MKKYLCSLAIPVLLLLSTSSFSQGNVQGDTLLRYFSRLANSTNEADKVLLETKLYALLHSPNETDWNTAVNYFYQLKKALTVDSIQKAIKVKFPMGIAVRAAATDTIYKQKDPVKKEGMYKAWLKKFPPEKFGQDRIQYDYVRNAVAMAYAEAGNVKKAIEYANLTETPVWKGEGWAGPAGILARKGHLPEAAALLKKAAANSYKYMTSGSMDNGARFAATGYVSYCSSLADILYKQKKYTEALRYVKEAHDSSKTVRAGVNATYANVLIALGKDNEAFELINEAVKEGQATREMKVTLQTLYATVKGSNEGYDEYITSLNKLLAEKMKKEVARQIISKPAAMFTLKDVDGNTVSLADYKGKTVILDFWATWCGPCKRSFPAMKMAVNKFKDDPTVKFLFIHTWEQEENATSSAKEYIEAQKFPFSVLMDLKDPETGLNKVVESYKVNAIPAKFVIDKFGNIRFELSGFSGGDDAAVEEITAMIELANSTN